MLSEIGVVVSATVEVAEHMYIVGVLPLAVDLYRIFIRDSRFGIKVAVSSDRRLSIGESYSETLSWRQFRSTRYRYRSAGETCS